MVGEHGVQRDEILRIIRRITRDFTPALPGLRLEVVPQEGLQARMQGKPLIADERMLRALLRELSEEGAGERPLREEVQGHHGSGGRSGERGEEKRAGKAGVEGPEREQGRTAAGSSEKPLLYALPASLTIVVEVDSMVERVNREDRRLRRPLVEGLILREVLYLMTARQPLPDPRSRAENILRRHWPFQYAALRSVGLTVTGFGRVQEGPELARDN